MHPGGPQSNGEGSHVGGDVASSGARVHCLVPPDLGPKLHERLRRHFEDDPSVTVIVEQRGRERRSGRERRPAGWLDALDSGEPTRRRRRNSDGRRVADRRAPAELVEAPELPGRLRRFRDQVVLVSVEPLSDDDVEDAMHDRLVLDYQAGDPIAFAALYRRFHQRIYRFAKAALRHHDSEDVAQDVSLKVLETGVGFEVRPDKHFRPWLFSIARNTVADTLRRQDKLQAEDPEAVLEVLDRNGHSDGGIPNDGEVGANGNGNGNVWLSDPDMLRAVERLPDAQRNVLDLRFGLDLSTEETAEKLGISEATVRTHQARAFKALQQRLSGTDVARRLRSRRMETLIRLKPARVMSHRRFALTGGFTPAGALLSASTRRYIAPPARRFGRF